MKNIGIHCDMYKLEKFEGELKALGFTEYVISEFSVTTKLIRVPVPEKDYETDKEKIRRMCVKIEYHFKKSN